MNTTTINVPKGYHEIVLVAEGGRRIRLSFMPCENGDHQCIDIQNLSANRLLMLGFSRGRRTWTNMYDDEPTTTATILL